MIYFKGKFQTHKGIKTVFKNYFLSNKAMFKLKSYLFVCFILNIDVLFQIYLLNYILAIIAPQVAWVAFSFFCLCIL